MQTNTRRRTARRVGVLLIFTATLSGSPPSADAGGLFDSDEILELSIRGPRDTILREASQRPTVVGTITLEDGTSIPITATTYGDSRVDVCPVPLLKITIGPDDSRGTVFDGQSTLWLVTRCRNIRGYEKYVLLEYLVYRSYAVLAQPALRARLASCDVRDSEGRTKDETAYAFFLEDIGLAASRHGMSWLDIPSQWLDDLDSKQVTLISLFQYMVGNTDWSMLMSQEDTRCCHNVALLRGEGDDHNTALPFDFDHAGLVNAPYAEPDERLGIRQVTQRLYRGLCIHNDQLPNAIDIFNDRRPELEALFTRDDLPFPKARARALRYIDGFYEIINDPEKLEKNVIGACRD